ILTRFFDLAGGRDQPLVVIPTAGGAETYAQDYPGLKMFKDFGVTHITVLHTADRKVADSEEFVKPLTTAKAVWFPGGRQWHLEEVIAKHPDVLGIGLDESTAIIVRGQTFEVTGASKIAIHDGRDVAKERQQRNGKKYYFMGPGERYDLTKLQKIGARPATTEQ